ncbi:TonB-dependent receptor [Novosphingobium sp. BL-52-GroH]|uniref:TonB-dependent receptor n=1 Tax=Novosphingobium sp. BL-52-GroH TaxID=3349877 RepID=UPI00384CF55E
MSDLKKDGLCRSASLLIVGAGLLLTSAAHGSEGEAADAAGPTGSDIVVTSLRRDSTLQDAPAAITALGAQDLVRKGVADFHDYYRSVPSLQITDNPVSPGASRISLRGIWAAGESTVGLYYGDTPVTGPAGSTADAGQQMPNLNLFDVGRVEVLRGPQGTLYGSGSVGGTIRVLFVQPDATKFGGHVEAEGSATHGGDASGYLRGALNIPLVENTLALRVVGGVQEIGGYVDNVAVGRKNANSGSVSGGRAILAWTPSPNFSLTGTAVYQESQQDSNSAWYQRLGSKAYRTDGALLVPYEDKFKLFSATANWTLPFGKLTATSSWYKWDIVRNVDVTAGFQTVASLGLFCQAYSASVTPCTPAQQANYRTYINNSLPAAFHQPLGLETQTHELRLASPGGGVVDWTVGLFYEKRDDYIDSYTSVGDSATGELIDPRVVYNGYSTGETNLKQFSQFAEVSVRPIEKLTLTGGLRHYDYEKRSSGQVLESNYVYGSFAGPATGVKTADNGWVGKVNLAYEFSRSVMGYVQWAQGFRPGGVNRISATNLPSSLLVYGSDAVDSYEGGLKASFGGGRYTFNGAVFQIDWVDIQSTLNWPPAFRIVANAGQARIRGLELEGTARPFPGFTLEGGLSYIPEAKLTRGQADGAAVTPTAQTGIKGDRLPYTARFNGTAAVQYDWRLNDRLGAFARADIAYRGGVANEFRPTYNVYERLPAFTEVNVRVGVETEGWGLHLFVKNLTNAVGAVNVQSTLTPLDPGRLERQLGTIRPRTVGADVSYRF